MTDDTNIKANAHRDDPEGVMTDDLRSAYKRGAQKHQREGRVEVDESPRVIPIFTEDGEKVMGAYVEAWIWVSTEEAEIA